MFRPNLFYSNIRNYSVPKVAIKNNTFKTFCPDFMVVSITDLRIANTLALSVDLNWPDIFCLTFTFLIARSEPLLSGGTLGCNKKYRIQFCFANSFFCNDLDLG